MDIFALIESKAHNGAFGMNAKALPTLAQIKAGNYAKGKFTLHGLPIVVEQPRNSIRTGVSKDGKQWQSRMAAHYGYIQGSKGADGDQIDVFIGATPENTMAYVINQNNEQGGFDEHKVMIGFNDADDAKRAYLESYERNWTGFGNMLPVTIEQLKWWLKNGNTKVAITPNSLPYDGNNDMNTFDSIPVAKHLYDLRVSDTENLLLDSATPEYILDDADGLVALDAMVIPYATMEKKVAQLQRIMEGAAGEVKPIASQVTQPFKKNGAVNVAAIFEMDDGQTVSILFHNPDTTPNKLTPQDEMVSWKWMLNKKDVTIVVAPEKGKDLNPREVATRIMKLVQANSARFGKANAAKQARMANIEAMQKQVEAKTAELAQLEAEIEKRKAGGGSAVSGVNEDDLESEKRLEKADAFNKETYSNNGQADVARYLSLFANKVSKTVRHSVDAVVYDLSIPDTKTGAGFNVKGAFWWEGENPRIATYSKDLTPLVLSLTSGKTENGSNTVVFSKFNVIAEGEKALSKYYVAFDKLNNDGKNEQPQGGDSELLQKALAQFPELNQYNVGALWFEGDELQSRSDYDIPQDLFARVEAFLSGKGGSRVDTESLEQQLKQAFPDASTSWSNSTVSLLWELPNDITAGVSFETLQDFPTVDMGVQKYRYESRSEDLLKVVGQSIKDASIETLMAVTQKFYNEQVKPVQGGEQALTDDDFIGAIQDVLAGKDWTKDGSLIANSPDGNFMVDFTDRTKTGEVAYATVNTYDGNAWVAVGRTIEFGRFDKAKKTPEQVVQAIEAVIAENALKEEQPNNSERVSAGTAYLLDQGFDKKQQNGATYYTKDMGFGIGYAVVTTPDEISGKGIWEARHQTWDKHELVKKSSDFDSDKNTPIEQVLQKLLDRIGVSLGGQAEQTPEPKDATPAVDDKVQATLNSAEFKNTFADILRSIGVIAGIDNGTERGYDRALFVNSIVGKIKTRAKNNQLLGQLLLAKLFVAQKAMPKPAVTMRNSVWNVAQDWEQYTSLFEKPQTESTPEPQSEANPDIAKVDAAYQFNASNDFKAWVAKSVELDDYSPFLSAKTIDEAVKAKGGTVEWGFFGKPVMDSVTALLNKHRNRFIFDNAETEGNEYVGKIMLGGKVIGRVDMGDDGKAMIFVGSEGGTRITYNDGSMGKYSNWDSTLKDYVSVLFAGNESEYKVKQIDATLTDIDNFHPELVQDMSKTYLHKSVKQKGWIVAVDDYNNALIVYKDKANKAFSVNGLPNKEAVSNLFNILVYGEVAGLDYPTKDVSEKVLAKVAEFDDEGEKTEKNQEFQYMMLSRLKSDNEYFLGFGGGSEKVLWAGSVAGQIAEMKKLYNQLAVKPEWLTMADIEAYEQKMNAVLAEKNGVKPTEQPAPVEPQPEVPQGETVLELPVTDFRPEAMRVYFNGQSFLVQTMSNGQWITQKEHANKDDAIADANQWYQPQQEDTALTEAKAFLQSVIDGNVDFMDTEFADKLLSYEQYTELSDMFAQAAQAYADWAVKEAQAALANM